MKANKKIRLAMIGDSGSLDLVQKIILTPCEYSIYPQPILDNLSQSLGQLKVDILFQCATDAYATRIRSPMPRVDNDRVDCCTDPRRQAKQIQTDG